MPMNPNFLCCIGAELKNSTQQTTRMSQVYLYRSFEDETLSDMLSAGFFNAAMGIIRQDDLLLLYSPNETTAKYAYARVSSVSSSGVVIEQIGIDATGISVDTTGYSNLSGNNLQEILNNLDTTLTTINNAFVRKDGSSVMTGPLKFRAGSFVGAIAGGLGDGISFYKLKNDNTIDSEVASLTKENGFTPGTTNAQDIGSSSLKWKDLYVARVITSVLNNGADINVPTTAGTLGLNDFSNITDSAKNIGNWSRNVTNCITEIPQDIKLELNGGTLTLKAGSKVYVPNGSNVFDVRNITSDTTLAVVAPNEKILVCVNRNNVPAGRYLSASTSGPGATATSGFAYDTTTNIISFYSSSGTMQSTDYSFPIAIVTSDSNGAISSIDQVFNGFGYIGSTTFILPGVKGLIPNGRNTDGTLKNTVMNVTAVQIRTYTGTAEECFFLNVSGLPGYFTAISVAYDAEKNINYRVSNNEKLNNGIFGVLTLSSGQITSFSPKYAFHAVDYNDSNYIANCAMLSDRYVDLTLPASGGTITAQADGFLYLNKVSSASGQRIKLNNTNGTEASVSSWSSENGQSLDLLLLVSKGDVIRINYNAGGTTNYFRFIYANGAK